MTVKLAPRNGLEASAFLRDQHTSGSRAWNRKCLVLQRNARGIPALYPSAYAASIGVPESERVKSISDFRVGMIAFSKGADPAGHVFEIASWQGKPRNNPDNLLVWTNDAVHEGGVDLVPITFFEKHWGHKILFGATWLNGYDFSDFNKKPVAARGKLGKNYQHAIEDMQRAIHHHEKAGHTDLVRQLKKDLSIMKVRAKDFA